ncbi:hypothetical protein XELAEV_18014147mg [Xenopus laevis]|uniref:Helix-turn-helix domain-containing protein n=1 Tax=Xenopus laevis TaxID=8355 RepID=A0A974DIC7_XENLA|nr:hypothetical protein XELAEV_18014147mg [Xenopus laevis]
MEVESLYPNIPHEDGIAACQHFLEINHIPIVPTVQLIRFILTHNYFSLGDAIYLQLMGSAMGSKMAPQHANLFMAQLEENYLASCNTRPLIYLRCNQFHPPSTLSLTTLTRINFLDTTIYIKNGTIQTSLYQKPTGRPAYLMWDSFPPHHIKKSIVFSQALRYNRICSNLDDRNKHLHSLRKTFVNQGSHPKVIDDQLHRATQIPRDTLLDYKELLPIVVIYNPQLNIIRKIALQPKLHTDTRLKQRFPELPLLSYRQPPNLRKMIVTSLFLKQLKQRHFLQQQQISSCNSQYTKSLHILDHYSCASSNVVYMISCTGCSTGGRYKNCAQG